MLKVPNFFIVGAPKCGTTALSEYLRHHPNVYFSNPKELGFFDDESPRMVKGVHVLSTIDEYLRYFSEVNEAHLAVGEGTVGYLRSETAIPNILDFNPRARLIAMVRNPVDLLRSFHAQLVLEDKDVSNFEEAWREHQDRRNVRSAPEYSEVAMLGKQLQRVFSITPKKQVKVIIFDDFIHTPRGAYEEVLAFLDLPSDGRTEFPQYGGNRVTRSRLLNREIRFVMNNSARAKRAMGIRKNFGLLDRITESNMKPQSRLPLSASFEAELRDYFEEDIRLLSDQLSRDLSPWLRGESIREGISET